MKKHFLFFAILATLCLVFTARGADAADIKSKPITWTAVTYSDTSSQHFAQQQAMCDAISKRTKGLLNIELYSVGEFAFGGTDLFAVTTDRTIEMSLVSTSYVEGENTVMSILEWPMLCRDNKDLSKALEVLKPYLNEEFSSKNVTLLNWWSTMGLGFYGVGKAPKSLADFKNLKTRLYSVPITNVLLNYQIVPISMSVTEVVPALQRGVVSAALTGCLYAYDMSWYDICDWAFIMNIAGATNGIWVNNDALHELPEAVQKIVWEETRNYHNVNIKYNENETQNSIDGMAKKGCEVVYCSDEDYKQAAVYAVDIWAQMAAKGGKKFESALADVLAALGK